MPSGKDIRCPSAGSHSKILNATSFRWLLPVISEGYFNMGEVKYMTGLAVFPPPLFLCFLFETWFS